LYILLARPLVRPCFRWSLVWLALLSFGSALRLILGVRPSWLGSALLLLLSFDSWCGLWCGLALLLLVRPLVGLACFCLVRRSCLFYWHGLWCGLAFVGVALLSFGSALLGFGRTALWAWFGLASVAFF
jgi:hypothetical protein